MRKKITSIHNRDGKETVYYGAGRDDAINRIAVILKTTSSEIRRRLANGNIITTGDLAWKEF